MFPMGSRGIKISVRNITVKDYVLFVQTVRKLLASIVKGYGKSIYRTLYYHMRKTKKSVAFHCELALCLSFFIVNVPPLEYPC